LGFAQSDSVQTTSKHSPRLATILSAVVPGSGQIYNRKYYKPPIIYAGGFFMIRAIANNQEEYLRYNSAYKLRVDGDASTIDEFEGVYSEQNLLLIKNNFRRNRDLSYIGLSVVYILNILDAYVDAHLFYFDIGKDVKAQWAPQIMPMRNNMNAGLSFSLNF
jgi:hypothetical protein